MSYEQAVAAVVCTRPEKDRYRSKLWADRAVREHHVEAAPCTACQRGARMEAYHCADHHCWHIGHAWPRHRRRP